MLIPFEQAIIICQNRFTKEHVPIWASEPLPNGMYPAPQYETDRDWYEKTSFYENTHGVIQSMSGNQTWPLGRYLESPYKSLRVQREGDRFRTTYGTEVYSLHVDDLNEAGNVLI